MIDDRLETLEERLLEKDQLDEEDYDELIDDVEENVR
mgnify:CR=1 FL=1